MTAAEATRAGDLFASLVIAALAVCFVGMLVAHFTPERLLSPAQLEPEGDRCIEAIERFRQANGRYPASLAEASCSPRADTHGRWQYEVWPDGTTFSLKVGDYERDGFVLYLGDDGKWRVDG